MKKKNILELLVKKFVCLMHISFDEQQYCDIIQFIKFGIVGLSNTLVSYVIYICTLWILHKNEAMIRFDYLIAQITDFLLSVLWSFYWNSKYVFCRKHRSIKEILVSLIKMYISYGFTGIILKSLLSLLWVEILGISKLVLPILNIFISVPLNYLINKFWTFSNK